MIKIQPISVWTAEGTKQLDIFTAQIIFDNLKDSMTLYYQLGYEVSNDETNKVQEIYIQNGNLTIDGLDYKELEGNNINDKIILLSLQKLNLQKA
jgi:hypothetical protein